MTRDKSTGIPFLDKLFDRADEVADGVGRALAPPGWTATDFIDNTTGRRVWMVHGPNGKFETTTESEAQWLLGRLNGGGQ